jgi:hypothetical protein
MMMPFQGCGYKTSLRNCFYYQTISKNPERVIAFRIGQRPIEIKRLIIQKIEP